MIQAHIPSLFKTLYNVDLELLRVPRNEAWSNPNYLYKYNCYENQERIGTIYLDLYDRPEKRVDNCTFTIHNRYVDLEQNLHKPIVVVNTRLPNNNDLTSIQCTSLFHEMGHATAGVLNKCHYQFNSGVRVKQDFVEVISQLYEYIFEQNMEQFCTKSAQSDRMMEILKNVSTSMKGISTMNMNVQYYFDRQVNSNTIQQNLPEYYTSLKSENFPYPCVYSHAFTSIPHYIYYGSFYYSYFVGQTIACDIYHELAKKNHGFLNKETGKQLMDHFIQYGGNKEPHEILQSLLGRPFNINAYMNSIKQH